MSQCDLEWIVLEDRVTDADIARVEELFKIQFPKDFIECALVNHGGHPEKDVFDFGQHIGKVFGFMLSFNPESSLYLPNVYNNVLDRLADHVYPFADDPGGNLLCFDYRRDKDNPTIVYWDHEVAFLDAEKGLYPVCDTFTELLHKLYETQYGH
ncbi:hypothetical protein CBW65_10725 [Tumebacillus avium]|uniref:Knr4/Smi1-like domain-containing protein n=1 Tax=Tumebacillus avium TaxID=1903704 RepID=A0A1Y0IQ06_9BACL|nr:SMI1/KNR4 family protein [Tumebacillus avium]ARU61424.1 hypothetical protein CBW65_10725 [Tumebacillus avium]